MYCQVCNSKYFVKYKTIEGVDIYQCQSCILGFVNPKTPRKKTNAIYSFSNYKQREKQFRDRYKSTISLIKKYSSGNKILEVGGGFGLLSSLLAQEGFDVDILEPVVTPRYIRNTSVHHIKDTFLHFGNTSRKKYDVIILYDVIEHMDDLKEVMTILNKLCGKKAIVIIQTPNYQSIMAKIVKKWSWWMIEDHRFFFSKKSLLQLFNQYKFSLLFYKSYEESEDFKKNLDGNFEAIHNNLIKKLLKLTFYSLAIPSYCVFRHLLWIVGKGGLHMAIWQYNMK